MTKTLATEVAEFNVRLLLVWLGGFDTPMTSAVQLTQKPLDADYNDTIVDKSMRFLTSGDFPLIGDHKKAVKAIYEVVVGEGVGAGKEKEVKMILGSDAAVRLDEVQKGYGHMMDVFGEICHNVAKD
jgi:NAD(P)-dependent dehydrogenase (short-subunit alcohol dehydrogenase family)